MYTVKFSYWGCDTAAAILTEDGIIKMVDSKKKYGSLRHYINDVSDDQTARGIYVWVDEHELYVLHGYPVDNYDSIEKLSELREMIVEDYEDKIGATPIIEKFREMSLEQQKICLLHLQKLIADSH